MAGLDFDDVLVVPQVSDVYSRDLVDISVNLPKGQHLSFPLFASPMVGVTDGQFVKRLSALGGLGIIHRFYPSREEQIADIKNNLTMGDKFGIAIKIGETNIEELIDLNPAILLVDTANGYTSKLYNYCEHIANYILSHNHYCNLMAGNVATEDGYVRLANAGCNIIRVGIGGGSVCSTRNVTGVGIPNITAILLCAEAKASRGESAPKIAIDGGIRSSGDFVKAVVAGADLGDLHKELSFEEGGVIYRRISSVTPPDEWSSTKGYIGSLRKTTAFVWDAENGLELMINSLANSKKDGGNK